MYTLWHGHACAHVTSASLWDVQSRVTDRSAVCPSVYCLRFKVAMRLRIFDNFPFRGHLPSKPQNRRGRTGTLLWPAYRLFVRHTVSELRDVKVTISHFGPAVFSYKTRKEYLFVRSLQPTVYIAGCFRLFHVVVEGSKGCLLLVGFSCHVWRGSWDR